MKKPKSSAIILVILMILLSINCVLTNAGSLDDGNGQYTESELTEFLTGSEKLRFTATPEGEVVNLELPSGATVIDAELNLKGILPPRINSYDVGDDPVFITGADFNNDLNIDLVTANKNDNTISVIINDGTGAFSSAMSYTVGDLPDYIFTADLNNDNTIDIVCSNKDSNSLTVFFNLGDGTLKKSANYVTADEPRTIIGGDFDCDNDIDLVTVDNNVNLISFFFNNGDGTFQERISQESEYSPVCGAAGDLDGDGDPDLIIGNTGDNITVGEKIYRSSLSIMMNKGDGTFHERVDYIIGKRPTEIIVADLDADTDLDIVTSNEANFNVSVLLNKGDGTLDSHNTYQISPSGIDPPSSIHDCDIDGDNDIDLIITLPATDTVSILYNQGDGTFPQFENYLLGYLPMAVFAADFDNDKNIDLATANKEDNTVTISFNNGFGAFGNYYEYEVHGWPRGLCSADLDNDGDLDIIAANYDGALTVWFNNGDGTFTGRIDYKLGVETFSVLAEDFDRDGDLDLAVSIEYNFTVGIIFNNGDGTFDMAGRFLYEIGGNPYSLVSTDLNNDNWPDLVASTTYQHAIFYSINNGDGTFNNFIKLDMDGHYSFDLAVADIDGDNDIDIICSNIGEDQSPENTVSVIFNNGDGTFTDTYIDYIVNKGPIGVTAVDLNNDGRPDIATANRGTSTVSILFNQGNRTFGNYIDYPVGKEPYDIYSKDINHDGAIDILVPNYISNSVSVLVNDGNGKFNYLNYEFLIGSGPTKLVAADINNDGSEDIVTVNLHTNTASIYLAIYYPANLTVDIGNDGDIDLTIDGFLTDTESLDKSLVTEINDYLKNAGSQDPEEDVIIPIKITAARIGMVEFSGLSVKYSMEPLPDEIDGENRTEEKNIDFDNLIVVSVLAIVGILIIMFIMNVKRRKK